MKHPFPIAACVLTLAAPLAVLAAPRAATSPHVRAELVAETTALVPGQRNWIGLRLTHEPHWHTYWVNPGDSGLATKLAWHLPPGAEAGAVAWPAPQRFEVGGLFNFGYSGDVVLPIPLHLPADAKRGARINLSVDAKWLVCHQECVPGKATLKLSLPVGAQAAPNPRVRKLFATAHAAQPVASAWSGDARLVGDRVEVTLTGENLPDPDGVDAFVVQRQVVAYAPAQIRRLDDDRVMLTFAASEYLTAAPMALDLIVTDGIAPEVHARSVTVPFAAAAASHP